MRLTGNLGGRMRQLYGRYGQSVLLKSGTWYLGSTVLERGLSFLGVIIFSRLLTREEYGTVAIFLSWFSIFAATITLNVNSSITNAKYDVPEEKFDQFVSSISTLGILAGLVAIGVLLLLPDAVIDSVFGVERLFLFLAATVATAELSVKSIMVVWQVTYQYRFRSVVGVILAGGRLLLSVILIATPFLFAGDNALARIMGIAVVGVILGTYFFSRILYIGRVFVNLPYWRYALSFSVPLIPHVLMGFVLAHFDRILIDRYIGREETGLYTFAYQLGEIVMLVWFALNSAWVPWFYEQMNKGAYDHIRRRATQYLLGYFALISALIVSAPLLVRLLGPPEFEVSMAVVPVVMGGLFFNLPYSLFTNVEFFEKRTIYISIGTGAAAILNVVLNIWLLPVLGYVAAAWTTLVSYVALFVFHALIVRYRLRSPLQLNFWLAVLLGGVITLISALVFIATSN